MTLEIDHLGGGGRALGGIKSIRHLGAVRETYTVDKWRSAPPPKMMMKYIEPFAKLMHYPGTNIYQRQWRRRRRSLFQSTTQTANYTHHYRMEEV